jgi:diaminopimelate decarboxylase
MSVDNVGQHSPQPFFGIENDCLRVGNQSLLEVARIAGTTPFYVYVLQYMTARMQYLRSVFPPEVRIHYSLKANPLPAVVHHLAGLVDGLDVASLREMQVALGTSVSADHISFAGPGKELEELRQAVEFGVTLCVESELELVRLVEIGRSLNKRPLVAIRVNPDFDLKASGMKMGGGPKPFGIDAERVPELLERMGALPLEFVGLHIFSGSQNLTSNAVIEAQRKSIELAIALRRYVPSPIRILIIGGGFGIPYFPGERPLNLVPIADAMRELSGQCIRELGTAPTIELGRYLVGEAGLYVTRIVDRKTSRGQLFLITDGGLNHHLAASGNFGQVIRRNYPVMIGNRSNRSNCEVANVVGPLCTPLDILAHQVELPVSEVGDLVVVFQSGAYGMTASPLNFLSRSPPRELVI